jgi:hypothetical protein
MDRVSWAVRAEEPVRHSPFYCGERSATICIVLDPKKSSMYSSEYTSGFPDLRPRIWPHILRLATKAMSDRFLGYTEPRRFARWGWD